MAQRLRKILQVELMYDDGTQNMMFLDAFHMVTQELLELKEEGLAQINQRANRVLAGHKVLRLSYKDDEADWCTLNKASLRDALIFASMTHVNDCGILPLRVTTDRTPHLTPTVTAAALSGAKPDVEEVERDPESQLICGGEIADQSRAIVEPTTQSTEVPEKRGLGAAELKAQEPTRGAADPLDLENPALPLSQAPAEEDQHIPDLDAVREVSLRAAMAQLLSHAEPSIRSAAAKALCDVKDLPAGMQVPELEQEHDAGTTILTDPPTSTSDRASEAATLSTPKAEATTPQLPTECSSPSPVSARVVSASPLVLGIEAEEKDGPCGDVTQEKPELMASKGARQVFRMGRISVPTGSDAPAVPACAKLVIVNDGSTPWPDTAAVAHSSGDDLDLHSMQLGSIEPGGGCEVSLELLVPPSAEPKAAFSTWAVLDEASGTGLGPVLLFEVEWTEQLAT